MLIKQNLIRFLDKGTYLCSLYFVFNFRYNIAYHSETELKCLRNDETYKTMKEIAYILGVSKPTLFRFLKANSFHETFKKRNTNMYDETTTKAIIESFKQEKSEERFILSRNDETTDEILIESLKEQISLLKKHDEEQKEQINKLHALLDQQQQLLLYEQQKNTKLLEENIENKKWWQWWK